MVKQTLMAPIDFDSGRIVERPNGFWWQPLDGERDHGPFASLAEAMDAMEVDGSDFDEHDADEARLAGDALGVPDWVDPETGHLADDGWTRIEDH